MNIRDTKAVKFNVFLKWYKSYYVSRNEKLSRKNSLDNQLQSQQPAFNNTHSNNANKPTVARKISPARRAAGRAAGWERFLGNNNTSSQAPTSLNYYASSHAKKLSDTAKPFEDDNANVNNEEHVIDKQLKPVGKVGKLWTEEKNSTQKVQYDWSIFLYETILKFKNVFSQEEFLFLAFVVISHLRFCTIINQFLSVFSLIIWT